MENLIIETNARLQDVINNLLVIKQEYEKKLDTNTKEMDEQLKKVDAYREDFFSSKEKIEKMNSDIEGFEEDYQKLVERFKDDELANILVAANKEISAKIEERKRKIVKDRQAMNELVGKAEEVKKKLVKLTAEKKALELCLDKINDSYEFYSKSLGQIIEYSSDNQDNLCVCFHEEKFTYKTEEIITEDVDNQEHIIESDDAFIVEDNDYEDEKYETENVITEEENDQSNDIFEENEEKEFEVEEIVFEDDDEIIDEEFAQEEIDENSKIDEEKTQVNEEDFVIEGEEHEVILETIPSQEYNFSEELDLENIINFNDELEDEEKDED